MIIPRVAPSVLLFAALALGGCAGLGEFAAAHPPPGAPAGDPTDSALGWMELAAGLLGAAAVPGAAVAVPAIRAVRAARHRERSLIRACAEELPEDRRAAVERRAREHHRAARAGASTAPGAAGGPPPSASSSGPPGGAGGPGGGAA